MINKTCIIICGATASGKTDIAIAIAQYFTTQIISADSRQCFKELGIAVAKPTSEQLKMVPHHFINTHSITEPFTAAHFETYALQKVTELFAKHNVIVMCGGTGLYIKAFANGLDDIATIDESIRNEINENYKLLGLPWLQGCVRHEDNLYWQQGEQQNPQRLMRALEVMRGTKKSIVIHQKKIKKQRDFTIIKIAVDIPRDILYDRINKRIDNMMDAGLLDEAKKLYSYKKLNALQTVGYKELFEFLDGNISLQNAISLIKQNTRHYAKRQLTWFKKDDEIIWLKENAILDYVKKL